MSSNDDRWESISTSKIMFGVFDVEQPYEATPSALFRDHEDADDWVAAMRKHHDEDRRLSEYDQVFPVRAVEGEFWNSYDPCPEAPDWPAARVEDPGPTIEQLDALALAMWCSPLLSGSAAGDAETWREYLASDDPDKKLTVDSARGAALAMWKLGARPAEMTGRIESGYVVEVEAQLAKAAEQWAKLIEGADKVCAHCQAPFTLETIAEHVRACDRNPMAAELAEARAANDRLRSLLSVCAGSLETALADLGDENEPEMVDLISECMEAAGKHWRKGAGLEHSPDALGEEG